MEVVGKEEFLESENVIAMDVRDEYAVNICDGNAEVIECKWAQKSAVDQAFFVVNAHKCIGVVIDGRFGTCVSGA